MVSTRYAAAVQAVSSGIVWSSTSYADVLAAHRWRIPGRLNIARIACGLHADGANRLALIEIDARGRMDPDAWRARRYTFEELQTAALRLAGALRALGVEAGDRVAVFLPQRAECAMAHLAVLGMGAISVPLSPLFRADALLHRLGASQTKVLITEQDLAPHVTALRGDLPELKCVLCCDSAPAGTESLEAAMRVASPLDEWADTAADDPAMIIYTSGTSGLPKGALHAHRFLPGRLPAFELIHQLENRPSSGQPFWTPADWAWVGGLVDCVLTPWVFGCPVLAHRRDAFEPVRVFELLMRARVRSLFLPPTALHKLKAAVGEDALHDLDVFSVHTAGEPLPAETYSWARRAFGRRVYELYGMTEMGATIGSGPFFEVRPGAMGKPYPGHDVTLLDGEREVTGAGEGEIAIRRGDPGMFLGYWSDDEGTAQRFRGDWFVTGDVARRDADGYFWYVGRNDDLFNSSGYRIGPTDVEATLERHPAVAECAVVPAPDQERGSVVKAFVVLKPGFPAGAGMVDQIQRYVKHQLAAYEYPRIIVFARELPRTVTGKTRRADLRAPGADERYGLRHGSGGEP